MNLPLQVGKVYQNRLGHYEVVSLNEPDEMMIRYLDSGEEGVAYGRPFRSRRRLGRRR